MNLDQPELWAITLKTIWKGETCQKTGSTSKTSGHKNVNTGGSETRGYSAKEIAHFVDQHRQLPEELLLKWIVRMTSLRALSLVSNVSDQRAYLD